jgi:hypothetical protein
MLSKLTRRKSVVENFPMSLRKYFIYKKRVFVKTFDVLIIINFVKENTGKVLKHLETAPLVILIYT